MSGPADAMRVEGLAVHYHATTALRDVTLALRREAVTAIVGPSGCGKTSFLNCLNRLTDLVPGCRVDGRVTLDGVDVHAPDTDVVALRRRVGMIFQAPNPFAKSIRENIHLALREHGLGDRGRRDATTTRVLGEVGLLEEVADRLDAPARDLSGGQQQRLCIARAIALEPEILLMDEPCSALDPIATEVVEDLIRRLATRYTVAIVTHNLAQARRVADDVAVFWKDGDAGTLIEQGTVEEVFVEPKDPRTVAYASGRRG